MRLPRMTIRRWLLAVMTAAIVAAFWTLLERWRLTERYEAASRGYLVVRQRYDEGRVPVCFPLQKLFDRTEAKLRLCQTREQRLSVLSADLELASRLIKLEENELIMHNTADIAEAKQSVSEFRERVKSLFDLP